MPEQTPHLNVSQENGILVAEIAEKKLLDEVTISKIGEQLSSLISQRQASKLVLDFSAVSQMSSSALGMLITLHKRLREQNGQLRLCCVQPAIYEVFVITRLNEIFTISQTREDALSSL